jgi:hypothetical protein
MYSTTGLRSLLNKRLHPLVTALSLDVDLTNRVGRLAQARNHGVKAGQHLCRCHLQYFLSPFSGRFL